MAIDKQNRERLNRLSTQMNGWLDRIEASGRKGLNADERIEWDRMVANHSDLEDLIRENEGGAQASLGRHGGGPRVSDVDLPEIQDTFRLSPGERRLRSQNPHQAAFSAYLRRGLAGLDDEHRALIQNKLVSFGAGEVPLVLNAQSTLTGSSGGALIPQGFSQILEEAKKWFGGIEGVVDKLSTGSGNPMPYPTLNDTTNRGRLVGQNVQMVETDLTFSSITFGAFIGSSDLILVPLALIEDSYFDVDALVARQLGIRLGRLFNYYCTQGTGTTQPMGIVNAVVNSGNILQLTTGNTASIAYSNLVDLEHSVDPAYRYNPASRWMFSDTMLKLIKKLVDQSGRPLWQPGLTASFETGPGFPGLVSTPKILEHEYVINNDLAAPSAGAYSMLFGDMSTFKVREVASGTTVLVLRERYADYLQVGYTAFQRFDSNLVDAGTHPIAVLQQSAS